MASDILEPTVEEGQRARTSAAEALEHGQRALTEAMAAAERTLAEAAKRADKIYRESEKIFRENLEKVRGQARTYSDTAGQSMDEAQRYVLERVKERPLTATVAGLGVGLLLGLLLANRNK